MQGCVLFIVPFSITLFMLRRIDMFWKWQLLLTLAVYLLERILSVELCFQWFPHWAIAQDVKFEIKTESWHSRQVREKPWSDEECRCFWAWILVRILSYDIGEAKEDSRIKRNEFTKGRGLCLDVPVSGREVMLYVVSMRDQPDTSWILWSGSTSFSQGLISSYWL